MSNFDDEFRIPLEAGDVLVLTLRVEPATAKAAETIDPTGVGQALLNALGLNRQPPRGTAARPAPKSKIVRPVEEDADEWLARTSKQSLRGM
jgi:hypothetical protein